MVGLEAAKMKHVQSGLAYVYGAIKMVVTFPQSPVIEMRWSEKNAEGVLQEKTFTSSAIIASVMNGRRMGGSFFMGPNAQLDDGELDLCTAEHRSRIKVVKIILHYTKGTQHLSSGVMQTRSTQYTFKALEGGMVAHSDGETICLDGKELQISCVPAALRLIGV
jgi:diacylglycerol kinase family enzyme